MITKKTNEEFDIGANPSAEEQNETYDSDTVTVINLVEAHKLQQTSFDKKGYMAYIKGYMKKVLDKLKESNPGRVDVFQKNIQGFVKKVLGEFDEYAFYTGEGVSDISSCVHFCIKLLILISQMDPEAMVVLQRYKEDGATPYFYFVKDGLIETKV